MQQLLYIYIYIYEGESKSNAFFFSTGIIANTGTRIKHQNQVVFSGSHPYFST